MQQHPIDTTSQDMHQILTPFQFPYPIEYHHVKEIESHKFQKAKINIKCNSEDNIFTFYDTLRHITASFNVLLRPLQEIIKEKGVCLLTETNVIGYGQAYTIMSTALHIKLTGEDSVKLFPRVATYVKSVATNSYGFKLIYRIVEIIHPQLRASKGGVYEVIESPLYDNVEDNSIYTFITRYNNYLMYKQLSPDKRSYNKRKQTRFILNDLMINKRVRVDLLYAEAIIQTFQRDCRLIPDTMFQIDLEIDEIEVMIGKYNDDYTPGEKIDTAKNSQSIRKR